jgi:hypothetical protein
MNSSEKVDVRPPSECGNAAYHGNPFRYCECGWVEEQDEVRPMTPDEVADEIAEMVRCMLVKAWDEGYTVATRNRPAGLPKHDNPYRKLK